MQRWCRSNGSYGEERSKRYLAKNNNEPIHCTFSNWICTWFGRNVTCKQDMRETFFTHTVNSVWNNSGLSTWILNRWRTITKVVVKKKRKIECWWCCKRKLERVDREVKERTPILPQVLVQIFYHINIHLFPLLWLLGQPFQVFFFCYYQLSLLSLLQLIFVQCNFLDLLQTRRKV